MLLLNQSHKFENLPSRELVYNHIESAGRTCYQSEPKGNPEGFIKMIINRGHETVLEHIALTCRCVTDIGISHEIVRHRIASYSQESSRYCDYNRNQVAFIIPTWITTIPTGEYEITWDKLYGTCNSEQYQNIIPNLSETDSWWFWSMALAERDYKKLRGLGWKPEQARSVLPKSLKTEIVMTMNIREWRHFFKLRTAKTAHPCMIKLSTGMLNELNNLYPALFNDILVG